MNIKIWAYLGIIVALLGGAKWAHSSIYKAGWNAAVVEQEALVQQARDQAAEEARIKWQALVDAAEGQIVIEEKIVEVVRVVNKEIPKVVERVVTECRDLGPDVAGLLTAQALASDRGEAGSTGVTPKSDP